MPWAWSCCTKFCTRLRSSALTIASGGSSSTRSASAARGALDQQLAGLVEPDVGEALADAAPRHSSTVSNSPMFSATHSSVSSGSTSSCTFLTVTVKSAGSSVPFGVAVNSSSSPAVAPMRRSSKSSATQPRPTSYSQSSVLRPGTGSPSRVAARSSVTKSPVGDRPVDVGQLAVAAQLGVDALVDVVVGRRSMDGSSTRRPP